MNQVNRVDNFQQTGKVTNYDTPDATKVADLIKNKGYTSIMRCRRSATMAARPTF